MLEVLPQFAKETKSMKKKSTVQVKGQKLLVLKNSLLPETRILPMTINENKE